MQKSEELLSHHKGDLTVENIAPGTQLTIEDGSLTVLGNIDAHSTIKLQLSKSFQTLLPRQDNMTVSGNINISVCQIQINNTKIGGVNIDNRIFTDDALTQLGPNHYLITTVKNAFDYTNFSAPLGMFSDNLFVKATIDGRVYQGRIIEVRGHRVIVDKKEVEIADQDKTVVMPKTLPKLIVHGNIEGSVTIDSAVDIEIEGDIGSDCQIISQYGSVKAQDVGKGSSIKSYNDIFLKNVAEKASLVSQHQSIKAIQFKDHVTAKAYQSVTVGGHVGQKANIVCEYGSLHTYDIGDGSVIKAYKNISAHGIGDYAQLTSEYHYVDAYNVGSHVEITAYRDVNILSVANQSTIESQYQAIIINNDVAYNNRLKAYKDIIIGGSLGQTNHLTSQYKNITVEGNLEQFNELKAYHSIKVGEVKNHCYLTACYQTVEVRSLSGDVTINAYKNIIIEGQENGLNHLTSSYGKIKRSMISNKPISHTNRSNSSNNSALAIQSNPILQQQELDDLALALRLSKLEAEEAKSAQSNNLLFFKKPASSESKEKKLAPKSLKIPEAYCCPITQDIMKEPVFCTLDSRSYEKAAITEWLEKHRNSPLTRQTMKSGQTISEVLFDNRNLQEAIETFKQDNPTLLNSALKKSL